MDERDPYAEILQHAADTAGSVEHLARLLKVSPQSLSDWMSGEKRAPLPVFLDALDIISEGPSVADPLRWTKLPLS